MFFFYAAALPLVVLAVVTALLWLPSKTTGWLVGGRRLYDAG